MIEMRDLHAIERDVLFAAVITHGRNSTTDINKSSRYTSVRDALRQFSGRQPADETMSKVLENLENVDLLVDSDRIIPSEEAADLCCMWVCEIDSLLEDVCSDLDFSEVKS